MSSLATIAATRLQGIPQYRAGKPPVGSLAGKLSSNEAALGAGPGVIDALTAAAHSVSHYPSESDAVEAAARAFGVAPESLLLTNGSDELCQLVATVFLGPGRVAVVGDPCYAIDAAATLISGASLRRVPLLSGAHDLESMALAARDAQVLWLPTPHNPTGVAVNQSAIDELLSRVPQDCLVVLDMAYADFADPEYRINVSELLDHHPHVLVQRTLSKAQSLAGLRVGVSMGRPEIITALRTVRLPFSVNNLGLAAAARALSDPTWMHMGVARVREGRALLQAELDLLGVSYYPSQANFVLAQIDYDIVREPLARHGLTVRNGSDLGLTGWTRITVGWAPTMATLRVALREALQQVP